MSAHRTLKARTAAAHNSLDATLAHFDLSNPEPYAAFLQIHARVLPAVEETLTRTPDLPPWRRRTHLLNCDLADLGRKPKRPMTIRERLCPAGTFGLLYVVEGSRLGGRMLLHSVGAGLPNRFLSAVHRPGEWREILAELNRRAAREGAIWLEQAVSGAALGFQLYAIAASEADPLADPPSAARRRFG